MFRQIQHYLDYSKETSLTEITLMMFKSLRNTTIGTCRYFFPCFYASCPEGSLTTDVMSVKRKQIRAGVHKAASRNESYESKQTRRGDSQSNRSN